MSSVDIPAPTAPAPVKTPRPPRVWKFWGTVLWGFVIFVALFLGQAVAVGALLWRQGSFDMATLKTLLSGGLTLSLSVVMGLPAVLGAIWLATRAARMGFADYLALRAPSWKLLLIGVVALAVLVEGWDLVAKAAGRDVTPGFMGEVLKSARADNTIWLLLFAFCVAAPITEEFFVRGFLYRGWSESVLRPVGAILLSSLVWTLMHLQYDWFFLCQVFSIGVLLGVLRYCGNSIWLTVILHGLNNLAATLQTMWLTGS
jgi:membrane protease YdiL (CAAX protease family)